MAPELRDLLDRSVAHPPSETHPVASVVHRARRSRRRHRALATAGSALAVVVVVGLVVGVTHRRTADNPPVAHRTDDPVAGKVVHPSDAVDGVPGRDYDIVSTYTNHDLEGHNGRRFAEVTSSGEVLVADAVLREPGIAMSEINRYGLLSPTTGKTSWLPAPPDAAYTQTRTPSGPEVVALTDDTVVWLDAYHHQTWQAYFYDRAAGTWSELSIPVESLPHGDQLQFPDRFRLAAGRLWFTFLVGPHTQRLWSIPVDGSAEPRSEGRVGGWDLDGDTLVTTDATGEPASRVTVRDLANGTSRTVDPRAGERCNQLKIQVSGETMALEESCGEQGTARDDRVQILTTGGDPVVTVQGEGVGLGGIGDGFVSVGANAGTATDGTYVYDIDRGRLVRLSTAVTKFGGAEDAGGSWLTWGTPLNQGHGMKLWAATWR